MVTRLLLLLFSFSLVVVAVEPTIDSPKRHFFHVFFSLRSFVRSFVISFEFCVQCSAPFVCYFSCVAFNGKRTFCFRFRHIHRQKITRNIKNERERFWTQRDVLRQNRLTIRTKRKKNNNKLKNIRKRKKTKENKNEKEFFCVSCTMLDSYSFSFPLKYINTTAWNRMKCTDEPKLRQYIYLPTVCVLKRFHLCNGNNNMRTFYAREIFILVQKLSIWWPKHRKFTQIWTKNFWNSVDATKNMRFE